MSAFTPGPWIIGKHFAARHGARTYLPIVRPGNDPVPVAVVHRDVDGYGREEGEANARLIGAAPDLLAACTILAMLLEERLAGKPHTPEAEADMLKAAQQTIAKATTNV